MAPEENQKKQLLYLKIEAEIYKYCIKILIKHMARRRKTKQEISVLFEKSSYKQIKTKQDLVLYLKENSNKYNDFMLTLINRQNQEVILDEQHHIIPRSEGGPDEYWNLISLSFKEHGLAHKLRYEVYGQEGDYLAFMGRQNLPENAKQIKTTRAKLGHQVMKEKGIGFYSSIVQKELGKRSGGRKTPAREVGYTRQVSTSKQQLFSKVLIFTHKELGLIGQTKPNMFTRTGQIKNYLVSLMPENNKFRDLIFHDKHFTTNINKILGPLVGKTSLARLSYKGWSCTLL